MEEKYQAGEDNGTLLKHEASNTNSTDINLEDEHKLRGDAIGNTMYSESFVAKTLLQLSDLKWTEKLEEDLCFLWDMTVEKDVCEYLFNLSFPSVACFILNNYSEKRLVEIIVGILANISCSSCSKSILPEEIELVLTILNSDDSLILIQVMRFIKAVSFHLEKLVFVTNDMLDQINFILLNSINNELLLHTLDTLAKITRDYKIDKKLLQGELVYSSVVAYKVIFKEQKSVCDHDFCLETTSQRTSLTYLIQIISNFCCYINISVDNRICTEVSKYKNVFVDDIFVKVFTYYCEEDLDFTSDETQFYVDAFAFIFPILNISYNSNIFDKLLIILVKLIENDNQEMCMFFEPFCYFLSVGDVEKIECDCKKFSKKNILMILEKIKVCKLDYEFNYEENLNNLIIYLQK